MSKKEKNINEKSQVNATKEKNENVTEEKELDQEMVDEKEGGKEENKEKVRQTEDNKEKDSQVEENKKQGAEKQEELKEKIQKLLKYETLIRIVVAIVGLALLAFIFSKGKFIRKLLYVVVGAVAGWEFLGLIGEKGFYKNVKTSVISLGIILELFVAKFSFLAILLLYCIFEMIMEKKFSFELFFFYPFVVIPLAYLNSIPNFIFWKKALVLLATAWVSDSVAYFVGSYIGKKKNIVWMSPNKSLEGFLGGFLGGSITFIVLNLIFKITTFLNSLWIAPLLSVMAILGDLVESYLKRKANVKDSSNIFPGHGGLLDIIDSVLFVLFWANLLGI